MALYESVKTALEPSHTALGAKHSIGAVITTPTCTSNERWKTATERRGSRFMAGQHLGDTHSSHSWASSCPEDTRIHPTTPRLRRVSGALGKRLPGLEQKQYLLNAIFTHCIRALRCRKGWGWRSWKVMDNGPTFLFHTVFINQPGITACWIPCNWEQNTFQCCLHVN